jgi:hypothetical protein
MSLAPLETEGSVGYFLYSIQYIISSAIFKNSREFSSTKVNSFTGHGITGIEIGNLTAKVDPNTGNIAQYNAAVKIAFGVEH